MAHTAHVATRFNLSKNLEIRKYMKSVEVILDLQNQFQGILIVFFSEHLLLSPVC